jgi:type I restriction enzyme S subunit
VSEALPRGWVTVPLRSVGRWAGGGTPSKAEPRYWTNGTIPWVSPKDMKVATLHDAEDHITEEAVRESATRVIEAGSVLIVTRSGILQRILPVAVNAVPVALNQDMKGITPHAGVDERYLYWMLVWLGDEILRTCTKSGTTVASVEITRLYELPVPLAPLPEQHRIVAALEEYLSALDAAVAGLTRARVNVRRFADATISSAVAPRHGWPMMPLRDLGTIKGGVTKGQKRRADEVLRAVPYLRVANVQRGRLDLSEMRTIDATDREIKELRLVHGDVLFNEGGDRDKLGRGWVWEGQLEECIHQNHVFRARLDRSTVEPRFVSHYANSHGQRYFLDQGTQTTNLASISMTKLGALPVPIPPIDEQKEILSAIDDRLAVAERTFAEIDVQLARAARLRRSILNRAFSGGLVSQDPADEPAKPQLQETNVWSSLEAPATSRKRGGKRATTPSRAHG